MFDELTCPYCNRPTTDPNSLCEDCWKEYLGTHVGGRMEKPCSCNICLSLAMRHRFVKEQNDSKTQNNQ